MPRNYRQKCIYYFNQSYTYYYLSSPNQQASAIHGVLQAFFCLKKRLVIINMVVCYLCLQITSRLKSTLLKIETYAYVW